VFGEIQLCQFPFTSGAMSKVRPALVLFDLGDDAIICRVTSAAPRSVPTDIVINDWQAAGLLKPSIARIDRLVTAEKSVFLRKLGELSEDDRSAIRMAWNAQMRL
jgi:mRNA interferase MazF